MTSHRTIPIGGRVAGWLAVVSLVGLTGFARAGTATLESARLARIAGSYDAYVLAEGLETPDGIALHPGSGEIYVSEKSVGRISVIREGKPVPVVDTGWTVKDDLPKWAITEAQPRSHWLYPKLRQPEGITFSPGGHLFVIEDIPDGRLLEFVPDEDGGYREALVTPIPWFYKGFSWRSVTVSRDDRLFLAGSAAEAGPGLFFGVVLMRDAEHNWWVVDYGPFAGFSSVSLSREQDILIVGEQVKGTVTWWDTLRHRAIGTVTRTFPELSHAYPLPDGAIAVIQGAKSNRVKVLGEEPDQGGYIHRLNPQNGQSSVIASGFEDIREICISPQSGRVYLTEGDTGLVMELRPREQPARNQYLLENTARLAEIASGMPPKKWPPFLKGFFKDLGVSPRDEVVREAGQAPAFDAPNTYTLVEVGKAVPLIAGKVRTHPEGYGDNVDPITDIDFIVLFPNRTFKSGNEASPGLAFFSAVRASGKVERTQGLEHLKAVKYDSLKGWSTYAERATVFLPTASCGIRTTEDGMDINLAFLSLDGGTDFYLNLECGVENRGSLLEDAGQGIQRTYGIDFTEETLDGAAYNTLVVAGFSDTDKDVPGWLNIGNWPMDYAISPGTDLPWMPYSAKEGSPLMEALWNVQRAGQEPEPDGPR
jgi:glucose/arabinose dehydrogenase